MSHTVDWSGGGGDTETEGVADAAASGETETVPPRDDVGEGLNERDLVAGVDAVAVAENVSDGVAVRVGEAVFEVVCVLSG